MVTPSINGFIHNILLLYILAIYKYFDYMYSTAGGIYAIGLIIIKIYCNSFRKFFPIILYIPSSPIILLLFFYFC